MSCGWGSGRCGSSRWFKGRTTVDDLPWLWADFGQSNTIVLAGMPRGQHKVLIELVDAEGNVFPAQTVTFHSPGKEVRP